MLETKLPTQKPLKNEVTYHVYRMNVVFDHSGLPVSKRIGTYVGEIASQFSDSVIVYNREDSEQTIHTSAAISDGNQFAVTTSKFH